MSIEQQRPIYIFIGPPGAGKGSLAQLCSQRNGWHTLSTGDLCRSHIACQTEIGQQIDFCIKSGKLVSDEVVSEMVRDWLNENIAKTCGLILDGFPRTRNQANLLEQVIQNVAVPCYLRVAELRLPDATVIERLASRRVCNNDQCQACYTYATAQLAPRIAEICDYCGSNLIRRLDDAPDVIQQRLQTYHASVDDVLALYRGKPEFLGSIDADQPINDVYKAFVTLVQNDGDYKE